MNTCMFMILALFGTVVLFKYMIPFVHRYAAAYFLHKAVKHAGLTYSRKEILEMESYQSVLQEVTLRHFDITHDVLLLITILKVKLRKYHFQDSREVFEVIHEIESQMLKSMEAYNRMSQEAMLAGGFQEKHLFYYKDKVFPNITAFEEDGEQLITTYLNEIRKHLRKMGGITHSLSSYRLVHPLHTKPLV